MAQDRKNTPSSGPQPLTISTHRAPTFGAALRKHRVWSNLGLRQLASLSGVSASYLSRIEHDDLPPPSVEVIARMAKALNLDVDTLRVEAGLLPERMDHLFHERPAVIRALLALVADMTDEEVHELCDSLQGRSVKEN